MEVMTDIEAVCSRCKGKLTVELYPNAKGQRIISPCDTCTKELERELEDRLAVCRRWLERTNRWR